MRRRQNSNLQAPSPTFALVVTDDPPANQSGAARVTSLPGATRIGVVTHRRVRRTSHARVNMQAHAADDYLHVAFGDRGSLYY
jgi:hypothetical protein